MFQFLCLSTTRIKGKVSWGQIARAEERAPAHLGFNQLLFDAFGRILSVVQLLQLPLGSLLGLADILQELSGLCARFYSLAGERGQGIDVYMDSCGGKKQKQKRQVILSTSGPVFKA